MIKSIPSALLITIIVVALVLLLIKLFYHPSDETASKNSISDLETGNTEIIEAKANNSIAIPGFEQMQFTARQKEQCVYLYNPSRNTCYFEITLLLPGGEELFHSGLLAPGKAIEKIKLNYTLEPGTYVDSILVYSCYSIGDMSPLNGANITFDLEVIE